jgi:glyoxylase-like metal-dependent hydrolase (beta-lactamase superfamily II)
MTELTPGLRRWTAPHPDWTPDDGGLDGWDEEVSSLLVETPEHLVLIDPLLPGDGRDAFLQELDRLVERVGRPVAIVVTLDDHERSTGELAERYDAEVWAPAQAAVRMQSAVTRPFAPRERLPGGIETWETGRTGEVALWLPAHATLVVGDAILGAPEGLRRCPTGWLPDGLDEDRFKELLSRLLRLPVRIVVPAHGDPVTEDAAEVLRAAVEA